jgi:hypothetical protein
MKVCLFLQESMTFEEEIKNKFNLLRWAEGLKGSSLFGNLRC